MDTNIEQNVEQKEDEISLLDLFAVLIRYRKLVIFGTLIITVLAGLYLFAGPMVFKKLNGQTAQVSYTVQVNAVPLSIASKLPNAETITPLYLATYYSQRLPFLVRQIKAHNIFSDNEMTDYEFNTFVQSLIRNKKLQIIEPKLGNEYEIQISVKMNRISDATALVRSMVAETEKQLQDYYYPLIQTLLSNTTTALEKASNSTTSDVQELQSLNVDLQTFTNNFQGFLNLHQEPFVIPEARGRVKKLIIIFLASFFVFVFAAFCKNAVANIKADPDSSKLISDAWNAGK
ncbi:MAG: hypothetical protein IK102_03595 [Treponema sp.]|nr:hypothetical protein [Treponema sp.]